MWANLCMVQWLECSHPCILAGETYQLTVCPPPKLEQKLNWHRDGIKGKDFGVDRKVMMVLSVFNSLRNTN